MATLSDPSVSNPVVRKGVISYDAAGRGKMGDGRRHWVDLPFLPGFVGPAGPPGRTVVSGSAKADKSVDGVYRHKADGTLQLYNADTGLYHSLTISGADGAVTLDIGAGES